jgi:hypothetical protein
MSLLQQIWKLLTRQRAVDSSTALQQTLGTGTLQSQINMPKPKLQVVVVGGGIGGLAAAISLMLVGLNVIVLEMADKIEEVSSYGEFWASIGLLPLETYQLTGVQCIRLALVSSSPRTQRESCCNGALTNKSSEMSSNLHTVS